MNVLQDLYCYAGSEKFQVLFQVENLNTNAIWKVLSDQMENALGIFDRLTALPRSVITTFQVVFQVPDFSMQTL